MTINPTLLLTAKKGYFWYKNISKLLPKMNKSYQ